MRFWPPTVLIVCLSSACGASSTGETECGTECEQLAQPFVCHEDVPQQSPVPIATPSVDASAAAIGGVLTDGTYQTTEVRFFGAFASVPGETLQLRDGFYHRNKTTYLATTGAAMTGFEEAGRFRLEGSKISFDGTACVGGNPPSHLVADYSVTESGELRLLKHSGDLLWEEIYELRDPQ